MKKGARYRWRRHWDAQPGGAPLSHNALHACSEDANAAIPATTGAIRVNVRVTRPCLGAISLVGPGRRRISRGTHGNDRAAAPEGAAARSITSGVRPVVPG